MQNPIFMPMLVRLALLDKDLAAVEKILILLTKTKYTGETDVSAAIIGLLVEGGGILQMGEIADVLERMMLHACWGTESGRTFISESMWKSYYKYVVILLPTYVLCYV